MDDALPLTQTGPRGLPHPTSPPYHPAPLARPPSSSSFSVGVGGSTAVSSKGKRARTGAEDTKSLKQPKLETPGAV